MAKWTGKSRLDDGGQGPMVERMPSVLVLWLVDIDCVAAWAGHLVRFGLGINIATSSDPL